MALFLTLEDFETAATPVAPEIQGPSEEWRAGHAAGYAEGCAAIVAEQATMSRDLIQRLEDMAFGHAEARALLISELRPLFHALATQLLPSLQDDLLVAHLADAVMAAAREDLSRPLTLRVCAADVVAVSDRVAEATGLPFACRSDPALAPGTALITGARGETSLDTVNLAEGLRAILTSLNDEFAEEAAHG